MIGDTGKYILGFLSLVLVVLFETSVLPFFSILGTQSNLLLAILLTLQFLGLAKESYYGAFFGGLLLDLLTNATFGFSSLVLLVLTGAAGLMRRFAEDSIWLLFLLTLVVSFIFRSIQAFPVFVPTLVLKGGLLDAALLFLFYPACKYLLKSVFGKKELMVEV